MTEKVFHFVRLHEVAAYERIGWIRHPALDGTHHGIWSALMEWKGEGEPVKPFRLDAPRETADVELQSAVADLGDDLARAG